MKMPERNVIILTGSSGSGKSTLALLLKSKGWPVLDADKIAHGLYGKGKPLWKSIKSEFGPEILAKDGRIDRRRLGAKVFSKRRDLKRLKDLAYPALVREIRRRLWGKRRAVLDMAVYFDAGSPDFGAKLVLVKAPLSQRVKRILQRGLDPSRALAQAKALRISKAQERRADLILNNAGSAAALKARFMEWRNLNP